MVRVVEVPLSASLQLLHEALLVCFGWSGDHLHEFTVRAVDYSGVWMVNAAADTGAVTLEGLGLRPGERFVWRYDLGGAVMAGWTAFGWSLDSGWVVDLRVVTVTATTDGRLRCVCGHRAGSPEWCGGPAGFVAWEDSHSLFEVARTLGELLDGVDADGDPVDRADAFEHLRALGVWISRDRFDKHEVDRGLEVLEAS